MHSIRRLYDLIRPYRGQILLNMVCNALVALFTVISIPMFIPFIRLIFGLDGPTNSIENSTEGTFRIIENIKLAFRSFISNHSREEALLYLCGFLIASFFFKNLFRYLSLYIIAPVRNSIIRDLRSKLFAKHLSLPLSFYNDRKKGDLISRFSSDILDVEWSVLNIVEVLIRQPLVIIGSLIFMVFISPYLTLMVIALILVTGIFIGGLGKSLRKTSSLAQTEMGKLTARFEETLSGLKIIQAYNAQDQIQRSFEIENESYKDKITQVLWRRDLASPLSEFLGIAVFGLLLWIGAKVVFSGELAPETFFAFLIAFFYIIEPSKSFANAQFSLTKGLAALDRIEEIVNTEEQIFTPPTAHLKNDFRDTIIFKNVDFHYDHTNPNVLQNINLQVHKGDVIAIVGASGSGKSTLVDLLTRFYDPIKGIIEIDGIDIRQLDLTAYRSLFGIVTQEPILFHDTIENNLRLGNPQASANDLLEACKKSHADQFISKKNLRLDTIIGDQGVNLSGGERQRLALARAILKNPRILLFDEATSALDSESEAYIQDALTSLLRDKTALIVAHRLSTIQHCNRIIVFKEGRIVEQGNHAELIKKGGEYSKFASFQLV